MIFVITVPHPIADTCNSPFRYAFVAESFAYASLGNATSGGLIGSTGFIEWGHQGGLNVIDCNVSVLHTTYTFVPPSTYKTVYSEFAPLNETQYISYSASGKGDAVTTAIQGAGSTNTSMSFAQAAALQLSKQVAAYSAILYDVQPAISIVGLPSDGAKIHLILLAVFVVLGGLLA